MLCFKALFQVIVDNYLRPFSPLADMLSGKNMEVSRSIDPFNSRLWNKNENQAWRMDLGDISYGLGI